MAYISPEIVREVKKIDLFTYLKTYEPNELKHISGNTYCTKTHDSLKISNGMWNWFSRGIGGKTALEYLIQVQGYSFSEAVELLQRNLSIHVPAIEKNDTKMKIKEEKQVVLPQKSQTNSRIISYLSGRCIDGEIINYCIENNLIYEDLPHHNVVFLGYDEEQKVKFGCVRATNQTRYMHDLSGSSKGYSFKLLSEEFDSTLHIFESAIDLLSYATILKNSGRDYRKFNMISLSGVYQPAQIIEESKVPIAIQNYLKHNPKTEKIVLHFDNDIAGRNATKAFQIVLGKQMTVLDNPVPIGKDVNDYLCNYMRKHNKNLEERGR